MIVDFTIKRGARLPSIVSTLSGGSGRTLTGATVRFYMFDATSGLVKVDAVAVVEDATARRVRYDWAALDTDTTSTYKAEWRVTYGDGLPEYFPEGSWHVVEVL